MPIYVTIAYIIFIVVPIGLGISIALRQKQTEQKIERLQKEKGA